ILLGLVRENEGVAARILQDFDAGAEKIRNEIIRMLSGGGRMPARRRTPARPAPAVELTSPPLAQEVLDEIATIQRAKEAALEAQRFEEAAALRDQERLLAGAARRLQAAWRRYGD